MSHAIFQQMDPKEIYALPQHTNQYGQLVVHTHDFAELTGITPRELEIIRIRLIYGLFIDFNDINLFVPDTILLTEALLIASEIE